MIESLQRADKIYIDTNIIIYFVEENTLYLEKIREVFMFALENNIEIVISDAGVAECLYGAYKRNDLSLEDKYNHVFYKLNLLTLIPVTSESLISAAKLGAEIGLKLIDALHFYTALETECDCFITNDTRFKSSHGLEVFQLEL